MSDAVSRLRSFHRTVTQRIGALSDGYLGRGRPLAESRLLFEIGAEGAQIRDLRARLGLDSGFLSRLLRSLESQSLVKTTISKIDGRVRIASLTRAGRAELVQLNDLSDELAQSILEPLSGNQRQRLIAAAGEVEKLLQASAVILSVESPDHRDAGWCMEQYFQELNVRFSGGFDPRSSISAEPDELKPPHGYFVVARLFAHPVGCGALKLTGGGVGEIKRMWVSPQARGLGVARRVLNELERLARSARLEILRLETNKSLQEAQALYRSNSYVEVEPFNTEPYAHHWFEKRLA